MLKLESAGLFSRHNSSFRLFVVIALIALLFGGVFLHAGGLPAILSAIFVFLFLLTVSNCSVAQPTTVLLADHVGEQAPARAPPISSL